MYEVLSREYQKAIADYNQRLVDAANKRMRRLEAAGLTTSPAYKLAKEWGGFSGRGLRQPSNWNALIKMHARVVNFLNNPTSTMGGAREYEEKLKTLMGGRDLTAKQKDVVFEIFRHYEEFNIIKANYYYRDIFQHLASVIESDKSAIIETADKDSAEYQEFVDKQLHKAQKEIEEMIERLEKTVDDINKKGFRRIK